MQTLSKNNIFDYPKFKSQAERFLTALVNEAAALSIPVRELTCDHLCFRVATLDEYVQIKTSLQGFGTLLTEAIVNGRPISTFRLNSPFQTESHTVDLIELPSPKPGTTYPTAFEHAEFIISECFEQFAAQFPHLAFVPGGNPVLNPELCLKLTGKQIKFHHHPLDRIIEIEESKITDIIFDFDGTLVESRETIYEINRIVFSMILERDVTLDEAIKNFHPEFSKLFMAFNVTCPIKKNQALALWGNISDRFSYLLFNGVHDFLHRLKQAGFKLHLWTARDQQSAQRILKEQKIQNLFTTLSFATIVDSKPHGNSLVFNWRDASKNQYLVVGDSPSDIYGSKNTAALSAAALWDPYAQKSALVRAGAELFFHDLLELETWVMPRKPTGLN